MASMTLASDYDGTLAENGRVPGPTRAALQRWRDAGHRLVMVTGREIDDLCSVFPDYDVFELIVGENGAVLFTPAMRHEELLADPPPAALLDALRRRNVGPLYTGRIIVATLAVHAQAMRECIGALHLDFDLILNQESVMMLPGGINKASGLRVALRRLQAPAESAIGVGDAENDLDLLAAAGVPVAVANAIPALKERAAWVTTQPAGAGIVELIDHVLAGTLPVAVA